MFSNLSARVFEFYRKISRGKEETIESIIPERGTLGLYIYT